MVFCVSKVEGKVHPRTGHEVPEGDYRYSPTLSLTSALYEVGGQHHASDALPPGKTPYPLYRRLGEFQSKSGRVHKISPLPGFDPRTVQRVASRYTDWAFRSNLYEFSLQVVGSEFSRKVVAGLSLHMAGLVPSAVRIRFMVDRVAQGLRFFFSLWVIRFSPVSFIPPIAPCLQLVIWHQYYLTV